MICSINITPELVQAFAAIATLILAIVTYAQGRKIKTLTDVVSQIEKQNVILEKRFNIEKIVALSKEIPLFRWDHYDLRDDGKTRIFLINKGVEAKNIKTDQSDTDPYTVFLHEHSCLNGSMIRVDISMKDGSTLANISFNVIATSNTGITSKQKIFKNSQHDLNIGFPEAEF